MISIYEYMKKTGTVVGTVLGGLGTPLGGLEGMRQSMAQTDLMDRINQLKGQGKKEHQRILKNIGYFIGGHIPIVGAITNYFAAKGRYAKEEELTKLIKKLPAKEKKKLAIVLQKVS
jgi:hypothetical protein